MTEADARLFLAVPLTAEARDALEGWLRRTVPGGLPGRAVRPESWHLTLRFLGETPAATALAVRREMASAELDLPFSVTFGGLGAFPRPEKARVLWLGVDEGADALSRLAAQTEEAVRRAGLPPERRPFAAHLTLSRLRGPASVVPLLRSSARFDLTMPVPEVVLFRSHLGGGPARYEVVERYGGGRRSSVVRRPSDR